MLDSSSLAQMQMLLAPGSSGTLRVGTVLRNGTKRNGQRPPVCVCPHEIKIPQFKQREFTAERPVSFYNYIKKLHINQEGRTTPFTIISSSKSSGKQAPESKRPHRDIFLGKSKSSNRHADYCMVVSSTETHDLLTVATIETGHPWHLQLVCCCLLCVCSCSYMSIIVNRNKTQ